MPRKFRGASAEYHTRSVLEVPECAALIGGICGAWGDLETVLAAAYVMLVLGKRNGGDASDRALLKSLDSVESVQGKRRLLLAAARATIPKHVRRLEKLLKAVQCTALKRNAIVHGRWLTSREFPGKLILTRQIAYVNQAEIYEVSDFVSMLNEIETLVVDLQQYLNEALPELEAFAKRSAEYLVSKLSDDRGE